MTKEVEEVYSSSTVNMVGDGFRVINYFPNGNRLGKKISPFILLDYHPPYYYPPTQNKRGVGVHPHRGFETVTLAFDGYVAHHDSAGNSGIIGPGDVQWMTAASGILHKEYHEQTFAARGGNLHMLQLWVNLPAAYKMSPPKYQAIQQAQMGMAQLPDDGGKVWVIAGEFDGIKGPAFTFTPINMLRAVLYNNAAVQFTFPAQHNTAILVIAGAVLINGTTHAEERNLVLFGHSGEEITVTASSDAEFVVLDGEPINETVVQYGPFVMNTPAEIQQATADVNNGKFGYLT